jgi:predicted ATPase/class 3 adenylate cyclase
VYDQVNIANLFPCFSLPPGRQSKEPDEMITCSNCQNANRVGAFFCKFCGHPLACPRCRLILQDPADYCDNCGQALTAEPELFFATHAHEEKRPYSRPQVDDAPQALLQPAPVESPSSLDPYVSQQLKAKLQAAQSSSRMVGERRVVTMLFCDIKGSTAAAEQLDPEDWTEIINGAFEYMIKPVYKYEGIVARLMGDAILAFFGAPIAHEDDPQRAVLAGLEIVSGSAPYAASVRDKWGIDLNLRVGINTGMVVVGAVGSDLRMEYTAMGDAVNMAARMEQTAQPGTVQIAAETYRLVAPHFEIEELGGIEIRGKTDPVPAYRVLGQQALTSRHREVGGDSLPLVGREEALNKLTAAMEKVRQGNGQILFITGDVGLGKSRLIAELHSAWAGAMPSFEAQTGAGLQHYPRWFETFSLSYETTQPYSLFHHFLRQLIGATQADPPAILARKLSDFVTANIPAAEMDRVTAVMETFFGLAEEGVTLLEGEDFKRQFYETISSMLAQWAEEAPGVLITDDLHWADPASIDLLTHLFGLSDRLPVFFLCTLRPDRSSPAWQLIDKTDRQYPHRFTEIRLEALSQEESRILIRRLLGNQDLPDALLQTILDKTAGNPYFIEEVVRALIDHGSLIPSPSGAGWEVNPNLALKQIAIPDSLQSTLMARIDRLDEAQKNTLQMAALIGQSFYYRVLKRLVQHIENGGSPTNGSLDQQLGDLQRKELIVQVSRMPELEYVFRQTLVQESAYKSILHKERRAYHLQVGEAMESLFPDQLEKHAIVLAYHFSRGEDYVRALKYHTLAGDSAYRLYAVAEAVEHYTQALEAVAELSSAANTADGSPLPVEELSRIYARRGRALELNARTKEAIENYEAMLQEAQRLQAREMEMGALMAMATQYAIPTAIYNFDRAISLSQEALLLAQELHDRTAEAKILWNISNTNRFSSSGNLKEALKAGEKALAIARELDLREQIAYSLLDLSHMYNRTGRYDITKTALKETIQLWRELKNLPMLADSLSTASYVHTFTADLENAVTFAEEAKSISESIANTWGISYSQWTVGKVYWEWGDPDRALQVMKDSIHYAEKAGFMVAQVYTRGDLALAYGRLGDVAAGLRIAEEARRVAVENNPLFETNALAHLARLHLMNGDIDAAAEAAASIRQGNRPVHLNRPDVLTMVECDLSFQRGNVMESVQLYKKRLADLRRYGLNLFLSETNLFLGRTLAAANQRDEALGFLEEGLQGAREMGSRWCEWQLLLALANITGGEQAALWRAQALNIVIAIAENVSDLELRQSFLTRPDIQALTGGQSDLTALKIYVAD